jgi:hypothetical protein
MHEGTPNSRSTVGLLGGPRSTANSLFQNILAVSFYDSIFYPQIARSPSRNPQRMNILKRSTKKKYRSECPP